MQLTFRKTALCVAVLGIWSQNSAASPFTPGDLLIYRVGDGSGSLSSSSTAVFVDEYSTTGSLVQSLAMPTASLAGGNQALTASGTATSEGELTISPNGQYVTLTGYDTGVGTASIAGTTASAVNRTVAVVNMNGVVNSTTHLSDFASGNNPRSAVTADGQTIWVAGGAGGVRAAALGSTTSTQLSTTVSNIRQVNIFDNQLYASDSSGSSNRLGTVGSGLPTSAGQTITNLPGFQTSTGSPYSFFFADLNQGVAGVDTLYVADDGAGITKYGFNGSIWTAEGTIGTASDAYRGLTGVVNGTTVTLYATNKGGSGASGGGQLVSLLDSSGYGGTLSATANVLATASSNEAFRGVVMIPAATVPLPATLPLLLSGIGVIGAKLRRRRNQL